MNFAKHTAIKELIELTSRFSNRPDQVQGPGGNTSVKTEDGTMFIKASGFRFEELTENQGISAVNALNIAAYFRNVVPKDKAVDEKAMLDLIAANILQQSDGAFYPKPSMETGFHAVLGKYVVHTHSVWANLINCALNSKDLITRLKQICDINIAEIPFVSPGFGLSYLVTEAVKLAEQSGHPVPEVFMLANHGIIAHAETAEHVVFLLETTDKCIQQLLGSDFAYPASSVYKCSDGMWSPESEFISDMLQLYQCNADFFGRVLFPDQTVFFSGQISDIPETIRKVNLHDNTVLYACSEREAISINETLSAYLFLHHQFNLLNIKPRYVTRSDIDYINAMDMEKYRKGLM